MAEIIDEEQEKEFKVRMKSKRHIRAILIMINLLLIGYFAYYISDAVVDYFQKKDDNFVTFNDMSKAKSKKLYQRLIADEEESYQNFYNIVLTDCPDMEEDEDKLSKEYPFKEPLLLGDYALYGTYLHLSSDAYMPMDYTPLEEIYLVSYDNKEKETAKIPLNFGTELNKGLQLSSLEDGDYLLAKKVDVFYKHEAKTYTKSFYQYIKILVSNDKWEDTIYSFPNDKGVRKEIRLYAYPDNPMFVIKIRDFTSLPKNYYDVVIRGNEEKRKLAREHIQQINEENKYLNLKIKEFDESETNLLALYQTKASLAIDLRDQVEEQDSFIQNSYYMDSSMFQKDTIFEDGRLKGYDQDAFIRELGGYALRSGAKVSAIDHTFDVVDAKGIHDVGKAAFVIYANEENVALHLDEILDVSYAK